MRRSQALIFFLLINVSAFQAWGQTSMALEDKIDGIVTQAIQQQAFPGCVVYAARKGKPFFFKAYGYMTYDSLNPVQKTTIYDLASVTKVTAATLAMMKLWEDSVIHLDSALGNYVDGYKPEIANLTIREMLAHQSGLPPHIQHYEKAMDGKKWRDSTFFKRAKGDYDFRLGRKLYGHKSMWDLIKRNINEIEPLQEKRYKYSGLFFYIIPELVQQVTGKEFHTYLYENFYLPMGAKTLVFNPLDYFEHSEIAPTEDDQLFRKEIVHGLVHDEGAAMMRGVSGNAGLFGNAEDLARVWQMFLNDGIYKGGQFLKPQTVYYFSSLQYPENSNYRGLGFDKPKFEYSLEECNYAESASPRSYGHTGFTGIIAWADPDEDLLYIFLSNRVYPSRSPNKLKDMAVRPLIHQALYDFIQVE